MPAAASDHESSGEPELQSFEAEGDALVSPTGPEPRVLVTSVAINVRLGRPVGFIKYYFAAGGRADAY